MPDDAFSHPQLSRRDSALKEADYARMYETLMESARGRWFLDEYHRRNRNADTRMVLDAVARIGNVVAGQQAPAIPAPADIAGEIRELLQRAQAGIAIEKASDPTDALTPARRAARIIREIAWQMRACGNDPRICNILDAQLDAIDGAFIALEERPDAQLRGVLEGLVAQIETLLGSPTGSLNSAPERQAEHDATEDEVMLERIAAEMATLESEPDPTPSEETKPFQEAVPQAETPRRKNSLGEMLIARGIIRPRGDRDAASAPQGAASS